MRSWMETTPLEARPVGLGSKELVSKYMGTLFRSPIR